MQHFLKMTSCWSRSVDIVLGFFEETLLKIASGLGRSVPTDQQPVPEDRWAYNSPRWTSQPWEFHHPCRLRGDSKHTVGKATWDSLRIVRGSVTHTWIECLTAPQVSVRIATEQRCKNSNPFLATFASRWVWLCVDGDGQKDSCEGDSGTAP